MEDEMNAVGPIQEKMVEEFLMRLVGENAEDVFDGRHDWVREVESFEDRGILTNNRGLTITFENGQEFQITIVRSA